MSQTTTFPIVEVTDVDIAFGGDLDKLMPAYADIPDEFRRGHTKWNDLFNEMFFSGLKSLELTPKEGIDKHKAWRHLRAFVGSWGPKHEHKEAAFAYLASLWFEDAKWERAKKKA